MCCQHLPEPSDRYQIFSEVVAAVSEGEVNEGISHETLTGGPIMQPTEMGGKTLKKASPLIKWVTA